MTGVPVRLPESEWPLPLRARPRPTAVKQKLNEMGRLSPLEGFGMGVRAQVDSPRARCPARW